MILKGMDLFMDLLTKSEYIVALTGAGISTSAGIPDFRGANGIYRRDPDLANRLFDISVFRETPDFFYKHIGEFFFPLMDAMPTSGHKFLKKLEDLGRLKSVITQNIDGLHQKAGNSYVIPVHGDFEGFDCQKCRKTFPKSPEIQELIRAGKTPLCSDFGGDCEGVLKPRVVFFGEPVFEFEKALTEVQKADLLICMGTSLSVYPVASLPSYLADESKLVIINQTPTPYDREACVVLNEDIDVVVKKTGFL